MNSPIAVVSHTFAPDMNGQAVVLGRLFDGFSSVVRMSSDRRWHPQNSDGFIDTNVSTPWAIRKLRNLKFLQSKVFQLYVSHRARLIEKMLVRYKCSCVIACTGGDLVDIPAAVLAAVRTRIPCLLHYFDDYRSQWKIPNPVWSTAWMQRHGLAIEKEALAKAASVVVPNELLYAELMKRVSLPLRVIRNPVQLSLYQGARRDPALANDGRSRPFKIVYTGSIYEAQFEAVLNFARAVERLKTKGIAIDLHLYTSQSVECLRNQGLPESVRIHPSVPLEEASRIQCDSDFLLLPLSFSTRYPELIRTSAPGKLGEYLAAGRPVLVHAPSDSFLVKFFSNHRCGLICDTLDDTMVALQLERLVRDAEMGRELGERALETSLLFSESLNRECYRRLIEEVIQRPHSSQARLRCA